LRGRLLEGVNARRRLPDIDRVTDAGATQHQQGGGAYWCDVVTAGNDQGMLEYMYELMGG